MTPRDFFVGRAVVLSILLVLGLIVAGFFALNNYIYNEKQGDLPNDFKQVTFSISGEPVTFVNGLAQLADPNAPENALPQVKWSTVSYEGHDVVQDLDGDGITDVAFIVKQDAHRAGTYFYLVGALKRDTGYFGTQAVLLGREIAPQATKAGSGRTLVVTYLEPIFDVSKPRTTKTIHLLLDPKDLQFGEVVQNFEGESR